MKQEFEVGPLKLCQDEEGYGVAHKIADTWEIIATFKFGPDAVYYFGTYLSELLEREKSKEVIQTMSIIPPKGLDNNEN